MGNWRIPRRSPKNNASSGAGAYKIEDRRVWSSEMELANEVIERLGPKTLCQGSGGLQTSRDGEFRALLRR
jgi:hypothetical protein